MYASLLMYFVIQYPHFFSSGDLPCIMSCCKSSALSLLTFSGSRGIIDYWILVGYSCVHQVIGCRFQGHQLFAAAPLRCHDEHRGLGPLPQRCVLCPSGVGAARRASKYHSEAWRFVRWIEGGAWCLRTPGRDGYWVESE